MIFLHCDIVSLLSSGRSMSPPLNPGGSLELPQQTKFGQSDGVKVPDTVSLHILPLGRLIFRIQPLSRRGPLWLFWPTVSAEVPANSQHQQRPAMGVKQPAPEEIRPSHRVPPRCGVFPEDPLDCWSTNW